MRLDANWEHQMFARCFAFPSPLCCAVIQIALSCAISKWSQTKSLHTLTAPHLFLSWRPGEVHADNADNRIRELKDGRAGNAAQVPLPLRGYQQSHRRTAQTQAECTKIGTRERAATWCGLRTAQAHSRVPRRSGPWSGVRCRP